MLTLSRSVCSEMRLLFSHVDEIKTSPVYNINNRSDSFIPESSAMRAIVIFLLCVAFLTWCTEASPFLDLFFGTPQKQTRGYGYGRQQRSRGGGGDARYREICRVHHVDSLQFPGALGNPVCP